MKEWTKKEQKRDNWKEMKRESKEYKKGKKC